MLPAVLVVVIVSLVGLADASYPRPNRPHIVVFVMDDVGFSDTSLYNQSVDIRTPNMNRVAAEGILLNRYYGPPVCSPSRASLMQGRWAWKSGMQHYCTIAPASTAAMPLKTPTMGEALREAGYSTYAVGKWHLGEFLLFKEWLI